jgi:hypothetical protein
MYKFETLVNFLVDQHVGGFYIALEGRGGGEYVRRR